MATVDALLSSLQARLLELYRNNESFVTKATRVMTAAVGCCGVAFLLAPALGKWLIFQTSSIFASFALDMSSMVVTLVVLSSVSRLTLPAVTSTHPRPSITAVDVFATFAFVAIFFVFHSYPVWLAYSIFLGRAAVLPFTLFLGVRGIIQHRPVIHDSMIIQGAVFAASCGMVLLFPDFVCRSLLPAVFQLVATALWSLVSSFAIIFLSVSTVYAKVNKFSSVYAAISRDGVGLFIVSAFLLVCWWCSFWAGWTMILSETVSYCSTWLPWPSQPV